MSPVYINSKADSVDSPRIASLLPLMTKTHVTQTVDELFSSGSTTPSPVSTSPVDTNRLATFSVPNWVHSLQPSSPNGAGILDTERKKSSICVSSLSRFLFGQKHLEQRANLLKTLQAEPVLNKAHIYFENGEEAYVAGIARAKKMNSLRLKHVWTNEEFTMAYDLLDEPDGYTMHSTMYIKALQEQATPTQQTLFLKPALNYDAIGCYAQTELGHGSNIQGLETTATWNQNDQTFTLHTPYLTAGKWWIGSLGKTANHAIVVAQLYVNGQQLGPHLFVCQVRDLQTHELLDGVYVGSIGPKFGCHALDNGFLFLNQVKLPHMNMLARFSTVDPIHGTYKSLAPRSVTYKTMTWARCIFSSQAGTALAKGVTIAVRYAAVRRQFAPLESKSQEETPVIEYATVQYRLMPLMASAFAMHFLGRKIMRRFDEVTNGADYSGLEELHAMSCALKAYTTTAAADGLEVCRRACGGHGYSSFSGIGAMYANYIPKVTGEGDTYVLSQQVASFLVKSARKAVHEDTAVHETTVLLRQYLEESNQSLSIEVDATNEAILEAFGKRVATLSFQLFEDRDIGKSSWNSLSVKGWQASTAYSEFLIIRDFLNALLEFQGSDDIGGEARETLRNLFQLFAYIIMEKQRSDFSFISQQWLDGVPEKIMGLLQVIRPHAITLMDSWNFSDWELNSSLGRHDGQVYRDLFERAKQSSL